MFRRRGRGGAERGEPDELPDDDELTGDSDMYQADYEDEDLDEDDLDQDEFDQDESGDDYPADDSGDRGDEEPLETAEEEQARQPGRGRRSRRARDERHDLGDPATWTRLRDPAAATAGEVPTGPWDSASSYPEAERLDFGCLLVPVREGYDVQIMISEETGIAISVVRGESALQLDALAAPKRAGIWAEVMQEIATEIGNAGGTSYEQQGPFGPELVANVAPVADGVQLPPQDLRFLGADGPRWFLRGLISGPAATDPQQAAALEEIFADTVVVRGEHAMPPQAPLTVELPEEYREAIEGQLAEQQPDGFNPFENPFERGPEITETR